jgi:hypothetical protein
VRWPQPGSQRVSRPESGVERGSAGSRQLRVAVAEAGDSLGTLREQPICHWKPLPRKTMTENAGLGVIVICKL